FLCVRLLQRSTLFPYTTLFRSLRNDIQYRSYLLSNSLKESVEPNFINKSDAYLQNLVERFFDQQRIAGIAIVDNTGKITAVSSRDRKSTRLNSSHVKISYAVFC